MASSFTVNGREPPREGTAVATLPSTPPQDDKTSPPAAPSAASSTPAAPTASTAAAPATGSEPDTRSPSTLVQVRHKDHDDNVPPGVVSLRWLRKFGKDEWVEVAPATDEQAAATAASGTEG